MIKNLIAAAMASIIITQPPQNANDETYYQDVNITESYEYETNEVNSVDDLIVGNIYHFEMDNVNLQNVNYFNIAMTEMYNTEFSMDLTPTSLNFKGIYLTSGSNAKRLLILDTLNTYNNLYYGFRNLDTNELVSVSLDFVFSTQTNGINALDYISASDYLGEKTITVEPIETEGLYNLAYHFLYSRIYTNTELQGMETTLFGTTINMNMWLSHTTAIVIICLLLLVLIKFILWLFKIVSGGMLWQ